ncbi:MAG: ATP-dependent dethiobiotin synthetase BioD [Acidimicrobiales bacterium]|nr:ATP-dependent dethiobiotin synthetase BioD [Acidimicrobiales bacterium]
MESPRKHFLVVVCGTSTEIGKTWVGAALARQLLSRGLQVAARKPLQSHAMDDTSTDADVLAAATGEDPLEVCPPDRRYGAPMAPPMAADFLSRPVPTTAQVTDEMSWPPGTDVGIVETIGGVRSPHTRDGDGVDLVAALAPDLVVLVADAGLGTVNSVRLSVDALAGHRVVVHLNRFDPDEELHIRNLRWLTDSCGLAVTTALDSLIDLIHPIGEPRIV